MFGELKTIKRDNKPIESKYGYNNLKYSDSHYEKYDVYALIPVEGTDYKYYDETTLAYNLVVEGEIEKRGDKDWQRAYKRMKDEEERYFAERY